MTGWEQGLLEVRRGETQGGVLFKQTEMLPLRRKRRKAPDRSYSVDYEVCGCSGGSSEEEGLRSRTKRKAW